MKAAFHDVSDDVYYVIMDKMEGSFTEFIHYNRDYVTEAHALVALRGTARALDYLHTKYASIAPSSSIYGCLS